MKIILSPAKKMITDTDSIAPDALPEFIEKTIEIQSWLKSKSKQLQICMSRAGGYSARLNMSQNGLFW